MKSKARITIDGFEPKENGSFKVKEALFRIVVEAEKWDDKLQEYTYGQDALSPSYLLDVQANDKSGEDGMLQPSAVIPVLQAFKKALLPGELVGKTIELPDKHWEAWYGNDAPALTENKIEFQAFDDHFLTLRWQAAIDGKGLFLFEGNAEFAGIQISVKQEAEADTLIEKIFANGIKNWKKEVGEKIDYGEDFPPDRRYWFPFTYKP